MKKMVNGKVVDIKNIEVFEKGFEGLVLNRKASSDVKNTLDNENELVKNCVEAYNHMINTLPFPLFAIESNCKYAFIANYMLKVVEGLKEQDIKIDNSIVVILDRNKVLRLIYKTWAIEKRKETYNDASLSLDSYKKEPEYEEMLWCYEKYINNESLIEYYNTFMRDFIGACGGKKMILQWELNNILQFGYVPEELEIGKNRILNLGTNYEYFLDIFCSGTVKSDDTVLEIQLGSNGSCKTSTKYKTVKAYDFDVYGKQRSDTGLARETGSKIEKKQFDGMGSVFKEILHCGIKDDKVEDVVYRGIMDDDIILFEVNNKLYRCQASTYMKSSELIASRVSIYGYEGGKLYMKSSVKLPSGVYKDNIYAYDVENRKARLCSTSFRL